MDKKRLRTFISLSLIFIMLLSMATTAIASNLEDEEAIASLAATPDNQNRASGLIARIMQGNTTNEEDCRAVENGLLDSGSYTTGSIVETGWTYVDENTSSIGTQRMTATNFEYAKLYDFAYYSGHGGRSDGIAVLNETPSKNVESTTSGTWSEIIVGDTLGVNNDTSWRTDCKWKTTDKLRVLMLAACFQLDKNVMHYYARAMRASSVRAIAGYHETGPGHDTDVKIADAFFAYANEGNSVKYSWQYGNTFGSTIYPWAVLVYKENNNEYYRIPGFPGKTYTDPSSTASIYRFRSGLTGSEVVSYTKARSTDQSVPLYVSVTQPRATAQEFASRESIATNTNLAVDTAVPDAYVKELLETDDLSKYMCVQTPVYRDEIDLETGGAVQNSELVVERVYHYYNTYSGIRIADAAIVVGVDTNGVYTAENFWKNVAPVETQTMSRSVTTNEIITELEALSALSTIEYEDFELLRSSLVYAPIANGSTIYKLAYELVATDGRLVYVDAEAGSIMK